jgi:hypothetical protein
MAEAGLNTLFDILGDSSGLSQPRSNPGPEEDLNNGGNALTGAQTSCGYSTPQIYGPTLHTGHRTSPPRTPSAVSFAARSSPQKALRSRITLPCNTNMINTIPGSTCSGSYNSKSGLSNPHLQSSLSHLAGVAASSNDPLDGESATPIVPASLRPTGLPIPTASTHALSTIPLPSRRPSAGPSIDNNNLVGDPNARFRDDSSWPPSLRATLTKLADPSGCMQWGVGQFDGHYKDGVSDEQVVVHQHQQVNQEYLSRPSERQEGTHTQPVPLPSSSHNTPYVNDTHGSIEATHHHSCPSITRHNIIPSFPLKPAPIPITALLATTTTSTNIPHRTTETNSTTATNSATTILEGNSTPEGNQRYLRIAASASSLAVSQRKLHRRSKSSSLSLRPQLHVNELRASKSMEGCHRHPHQLHLESGLIVSDLNEMIHSPNAPQTDGLSQMVATSGADVPRYCSSNNGAGVQLEHPQHQHHNHHNHSQFMDNSLSSESLHAQYAFNSEIVSRSHSISSLHSTPIHETPEDAEEHRRAQFRVRRSSDAAAESVFVDQQNPHSSFIQNTGDYSHRAAAWAAQQAFTPEHNIAEDSPVIPDPGPISAAVAAVTAAHWWGAAAAAATEVEEHKAREAEAAVEEWARQETTHVTLASHAQYQAPPTPANISFDRGTSVEPYISSGNNQTHLLYVRQPLSPAEADYEVVRLKSSPAVPSPPESPGYQFGFGVPHSWPSYPQYPQDHSRSSIPPTPPSRPPSTSNSSTTVIAAAAAALAATKPAKVKSHHTRPASRRKPSSSSMRSSKHLSHPPAPDMSSGEMNFVNFTPNDATRILSGVAPSGSSKTKARREREAMEKRRKLNEAAAAAVLAVGGDASALAKVNLF